MHHGNFEIWWLVKICSSLMIRYLLVRQLEMQCRLKHIVLSCFDYFILTIPDSRVFCLRFRYCDFGIRLVANRCLYQTDTLCQRWDDSSKQQQRLATKSLIHDWFFANQSDLWFWSWNDLDAQNLWHLRHRCVPQQKQVMPAMAERRGWPAAVALQGSGSWWRWHSIEACCPWLMKCLLRGYSILNCKNRMLKGLYNLYKGSLGLSFCFFLGGVERQQGLLYVCGGRDEQREPLSSMDLRVQWGSVAKAQDLLESTCVFAGSCQQ